MSFELPEDLDGVDFLTKEDVIDIHDNVALIEGGATGILKEDDLLGSIGLTGSGSALRRGRGFHQVSRLLLAWHIHQPWVQRR